MMGRVAICVALVCALGCQRSRPKYASPAKAWELPPPVVGWNPYVAPAPSPKPPDEPIPREPVAPEPMHSRIDVTMATPGDAAQALTVELTAPGGGVLWSCERQGPLRDERLDAVCPLPDKWWQTRGVYELGVRYKTSSTHRVTQKVPIHGAEVALEARIALTGEKAKLTVTRVEAAPPQFRLERRFAVPWHPAMALYYALVNGDSMTNIVANAVQGHLLGTLEVKSSGGWVPHERGVVCDVEHATDKIAAGASATVVEGHYVGELRPLSPGKYRFRVRFQRDGAPVKSEQAQLIQAFEIQDRIHVAKSSQRPVDPNVDCDSPFSIDRWGLRRAKPECL